MRFLAVYSITLFQVDSANSEVCSKFSEKKSRKFFSHALLQITKKPQKPLWDALSNTLHQSLQTEWRNTFFSFFYKGFEQNAQKKMIPEKFADFIIAVTGNRIECEGERQKYSKYIIVFRVFRFLSPTKLNRDEQTGYSEAHSIQPLCLREVGTCSVLRV